MGIRVYSFLWVMQDLCHQPCEGRKICTLHFVANTEHPAPIQTGRPDTDPHWENNNGWSPCGVVEDGQLRLGTKLHGCTLSKEHGRNDNA